MRIYGAPFIPFIKISIDGRDNLIHEKEIEPVNCIF